MEDARLANMFYEQRGPLVFSASVHLVLVVFAAVWVLVSPEKEKEPFNFELVPPPSGGAVQPVEEQPAETMESVTYERQPHEELPTLEDLDLPERPPIEIVVEAPPEPEPVVVEQPKVVVAPPKPKAISWEEFQKQNKDANEMKSKRTTPVVQKRPQIDLTKNIAALKRSLSQFKVNSISPAEIANYSLDDQAALSGYIAAFKEALKRSVDDHPSRAKLSALVSCDISAYGTVSNVRILRSSGDSVFDGKVRAGYARLSRFSAPPKGTALLGLEIEFIQD